MPKITTITQMLFFCARFVPGFSPSFGVYPAFIGFAESEGFEPPRHGIRYRGDKRIRAKCTNSCFRDSYLQYVKLSIRAILQRNARFMPDFLHIIYITRAHAIHVYTRILTYVYTRIYSCMCACTRRLMRIIRARLIHVRVDVHNGSTGLIS